MLSFKKLNLEIVSKIIWIRLAQIIINDYYKRKEFDIPIHLALGHETLAVSIDKVLKKQDALFLTHRNIHYNLARMGSLKEELDEYYLKKTGLAEGKLGSMNLSNPKKNIFYSSSILGNNLAVGSGFALANKIKNKEGIVFIITGDGAIEEGVFYETLLFLKSNQLPCVIIVENNEWSLGTRIEERRSKIDLSSFAKTFDIDYQLLQNNDPFDYIKTLGKTRAHSIKFKLPSLVEVKLTTLGYWYMKNDDFPKGKFINYHAGPLPKLNVKNYPIIKENSEDPLHILSKYIEMNKLIEITNKLQEKLIKELL